MRGLETTRNPSISIIRVIAMLSIIVGHWCLWRGIYLYDMGGIGVEIFLFISGFLYANKKLGSGRRWIFSRIVRLMPEVWVTTLIYTFVCLIQKNVNGGATLVHLCGISGLGFVFPGVVVPTYDALGPLWFVTAIFICYLVLLFVKRTEPKSVDAVLRHPYISLCGAVILVCTSNYLHIQTSYLVQFFIGYYVGKSGRSFLKPKCFTFVTSFAVVIGVVRIVFQQYLDGTIFYNRVVSMLSHNVIAIWLILVMAYVIKLLPRIVDIANSRIFKHIDALSYSLFAVHYIFLFGVLRLERFVTDRLLQDILFVGLTIVMAEIVYWVSIGIRRIMKKALD